MPNGISQQDAVYQACEEIGGVSSIKALIETAGVYYGGTIHPVQACTYRTAWRKSKGLVKDCRTYKSQPRRDMRNDNRISKGQKRRFSGLSGDVLSTLLYVVGEGGSQFHSVKQLRNALHREIINLNQKQFAKK